MPSLLQFFFHPYAIAHRLLFSLSVLYQCAVQVVAIFLLTARINHACDPCAEVRSQEFVDCNIDVVATRDILQGQEITISYINVGRLAGKSARNKTRRMRELRAKYLFDCDCTLCSNTT